MTSKIEISHRTIIFTVLFLAAVWLILEIRDILFLLFIAFILMTALRPLVDGLERLKLPRMVAILSIYAVVFGFFGISLAGTIPSLVLQSTRLIQELPDLVARLTPYWDVDVRSLTQQIAPISENIVKLTVGIFSNIVAILTVLVFTFYFLLERKHIESLLIETMGEEAAEKTIKVVKIIEQRLGAWLHGQLFLMFFIGILVYAGLTLLHVEFALPLALIAGALEIIPLIGPIVSAIPAVLIALATSPFLALSVVALYFIVQQIENHLVVPLVMRRSLGLPPILTILSLMIGGRLAGIIGAILAVPVMLVLQVITSAMLSKSVKEK